MSQSSEKLRELMKSIKFGMLTTFSSDATLRSRPMTLQTTDFDGDMWFFTGKSTTLAHDIEGDSRVNISFSDGSASFVSVAGKGRFVNDPAKAKELWSEMYKAWFPGGLEDPNLLLLKIEIDNAEYWDTPGGKVMQLLGYVKMVTTGKPATGVHEEVKLHDAK